VGAGVHHDDTVAGTEQKFGLGYDADAVVRYAVEEEYPVGVRMVGADEPASQEDAVGGADVEVFAMAAAVGEARVGFADEVRGELTADGVEEIRGDEPAGDACQEGRQEEEEERDTDKTAA
jgi:hypothetical protein